MASYRKMGEKLMVEATAIAQEEKKDIEEAKGVFIKAVERISNNGRKKAPPPPKGGISQSEASRKYKIPQRTISRWTERGLIPVKLRTNKEVYIDEATLKNVVKRYKENPGQGKKTINNPQ